MIWKTSKRELDCSVRPMVMGVLNVTPDSFSDGGRYLSIDDALRRAEMMISEGADIIDIGGESTRPGSQPVSVEIEIERTAPVISAIASRFDVSLSIDTAKSEVAASAVDAGAEIINDISGFRFDKRIAAVAAKTGAGLVLMHSRGTFETMHTQPQVVNIFDDVIRDFRRSIALAESFAVTPGQIALDIGIGFGKTSNQNLELIAKLDKIVSEFSTFPIVVGTSRKSFIGKLLGDAGADKRLYGSLASIAIAVFNGARILRVHDVIESVNTIKIAAAIVGENVK